MTDRPYLTKAEFWALPKAERDEIEFHPNAWEYDQASDRWVNRWHPENELWRLEREAAEARGML